MPAAQLKRAGLLAGAVMVIASAQPAAAGSGGWADREWPNPRESASDAPSVPELQMRGLRLESSTVLPNGMQTWHSVTLRCAGEPLPCVLAGTFVGPFGGDWDFSGDVIGDGTSAVVALDVDTPDGRTVPLTITVSRDEIARLLRPQGDESCSDPQY